MDLLELFSHQNSMFDGSSPKRCCFFLSPLLLTVIIAAFAFSLFNAHALSSLKMEWVDAQLWVHFLLIGRFSGDSLVQRCVFRRCSAVEYCSDAVREEQKIDQLLCLRLEYNQLTRVGCDFPLEFRLDLFWFSFNQENWPLNGMTRRWLAEEGEGGDGWNIW